jgi:hypothetical protein
MKPIELKKNYTAFSFKYENSGMPLSKEREESPQI